MARKSKRPVAIECGWVREFTQNDDGTYTVSIAFMPRTRAVTDKITSLCRGVDYWNVKLDEAMARALNEAFENCDQISYDPDLMRRLSFHRVPWETYSVAE